jgi:Na+/H+ antiporter NhaD/arsenite permease-like protein
VYTAMIAVFLTGYVAITFEHTLKVNKAAIAVLTGVFCWSVYISVSPDHNHVISQLIEQSGSFSGILFFLMCAMTIVELIDMHYGFEIITNRIKVTDKRQLLWIMGSLAFFLSAVLDNLTTTIVMISLLLKFTLNKEERFLFIGIIIIAANAGGAWSPIGDVTTTMLWIDGRITSSNIIAKLFLPSLVCAVVPIFLASLKIKGKLEKPTANEDNLISPKTRRDRNIVFFFGIFMLLFVPVFKTLTHLPPFMGMLLALGSLWLLTELLHAKKEESEKRIFSVSQALSNVDMQSVLFFLGILISISALEAAGILGQLSSILDRNIGNTTMIGLIIGLLSAVVDNVPLVAGSIGMYGLDQYAVDHHFWTFLSYCAGTGGSALIIGSAAGVAAMGLAKMNFIWYLRRITPLALAGYFAGTAVYLIQMRIHP